MSIENQFDSMIRLLTHISDTLDKMAGAGIPAPGPQPAQAPFPGPVPAPQAPPSGPAPMPMGPVGVPTPPPVPAPGVPTAPAIPAPGVTLDDIRAAANDFHRAHPDRATEVMNILNGVQAQKMDQIQPQFYQHVFDSIKALGA